MTASKGIKGRGFRFDLLGQQFGRLTVVSFSHVTDKRKAMWNCRCSCGEETLVMGNRLKAGKTRSCGCLQIELTSTRATRHGMSKSAEYRIYKGILNRCLNPNVRCYQRYGARGIGVCDRWRLGEGDRTGFECFLADMGPRPNAGASVDRRDNDLGYHPSNCRWASPLQQANNTSRNRVVNVADQYLTLAEAVRTFSPVGYATVQNRLAQGWREEAAVLAPKHCHQADFDAAFANPFIAGVAA